MPKPISKNTLFYGDNLAILREYVLDESIDMPKSAPGQTFKKAEKVKKKDKEKQDKLL